MDSFFETVRALLADAESANADAIREGAARIADSLASGGVLHVFGTGHAHMLAEELFYRAGGLVPVNAMLDPTLMLHEAALSSSLAERLPGYADVVLARYTVLPGEVLIVASNSGRNAVPVEMALAGRERGLYVIALTSMAHARSQPSRHPTGKHLHDVADLVLDNRGVPGDAIMAVEGVGEPMGATSTVVGAAILHALVLEAVRKLVEKGCPPPLFRSANLDGAEDANARLVERYRGRLRHL